MPVPAGYTLDTATAPKLPPGYTLDAPAASAPAGMPKGMALPGLAAHAAAPSMNAQPNGPGFLSSFADSTGLSALRHPIDNGIAAAKSVGRSLINPYDPNGAYIKTVTPIIGNAADQGGQALNMAKQGSLGAAASHALLATPVLGQGMQRAMDQTQGDQGSYGANLKSLITNPGAMGTLTGTSAVLADPAARGLTRLPGGTSALSAATNAVPSAISRPINAIPSLVGSGLKRLGTAAQDAGIGTMNKTVGALTADFKRGSNPGRGYFEAGGGPVLSMQGLADQSSNLKSATGARMGELRDAATASGTKLPTSDVSGVVAAPIAKARALESGPGGLGNTGTIDAYADNLAPTFQKAFAAGNGISPNDLFDLKRDIAQNTNWSDPSQFNLKAVRQQQTGALGGLLSDSVPQYGAAARTYGDLGKMSARAAARAATGSVPLSTLITKAGLGTLGFGLGSLESTHTAAGLAGLGTLLDTVPVKSLLASGSYYGGKGLGVAGRGLSNVNLLDAARVSPALYEMENAGNSDQNSGQNNSQQGVLPLRRLPVPQY